MNFNQSTLSKIFGIVLLVLFGNLIWCSFMIKETFQQEQLSYERSAEVKQLGIDLDNASDYLTDEARKYVQFGDKVYFDNYWREVNETKTREKIIQRLKELNVLESELAFIDKAKSNSENLVKTEEAAMQAVAQSDFEQARRLMFDSNYERNKKLITEPLEEFQKTVNAREEQELKETSERLSRYIVFIVILIILTAIVSVINMLVVWQKLIKPIIILESSMLELAQGNLVSRIPIEPDETEIGNLTNAINETQKNLRSIVGTIKDISERLAFSSKEFANSAQESSNAIDQVSVSIEETSRGTESQTNAALNTLKITKKINEMLSIGTKTAFSAAEMTNKASSITQEGRNTVNTAVIQMKNIEISVLNCAETISALGKRSQEIGQIVETISGIAGQTNLLALNAAIEAARAGEQGRGFAVVAEEVRKLAEQSQLATEQISTLIKDIQEDTNKAVKVMNEGTTEVSRGSEVVNKAGQAFTEIESITKEVSNIVLESVHIYKGLSENSQEVLTSVDSLEKESENISSQTQNISTATEELSASIQQLTATSEVLAKMATEMQNKINEFKV